MTTVKKCLSVLVIFGCHSLLKLRCCSGTTFPGSKLQLSRMRDSHLIPFMSMTYKVARDGRGNHRALHRGARAEGTREISIIEIASLVDASLLSDAGLTVFRYGPP